MAKDGQQVRFASDDGYVHRRIGCKGRKYAAAQGKGTRKAGIRRKDGIAAGYARQRVRMTGQRGAYAVHQDGQGLAVAGLPVQSAEIQL